MSPVHFRRGERGALGGRSIEPPTPNRPHQEYEQKGKGTRECEKVKSADEQKKRKKELTHLGGRRAIITRN
jgi:hypothetical protein